MAENGRKISKVTYSDGSKYSGEMKGFLRHGHGTYKWFNGGRYTGNWVEGEMDGKGTMTYIDGSTYVGMFQFGTEHGEGKFKSYDGFKYQGEFVEGKPLGGDEYLPPFRSPEPKALEWAEKNKWFGEDEWQGFDADNDPQIRTIWKCSKFFIFFYFDYFFFLVFIS